MQKVLTFYSSTSRYVFPVCCWEGIHLDFEQLVSWMKFEKVDDFSKYNSRLSELQQRVSYYSYTCIMKSLHKILNMLRLKSTQSEQEKLH